MVDLAVVVGKPAFAIPFPLVGEESIVEHVQGTVKKDSTFYQEPLESAQVALEGIVNCIKGTLTYLDIPCENLLIQIKSSIPPGKGLGSSASVAIAVIRSLFAYADVVYTDEELLHLANVAET